jgi:hypothetical protein
MSHEGDAPRMVDFETAEDEAALELDLGHDPPNRRRGRPKAGDAPKLETAPPRPYVYVGTRGGPLIYGYIK